MINPPYCRKDFAQCKTILEGMGWQVRERGSADEEVPNALFIVLHPHLPLKVAIYALEDIQLLAQSVTNHYLFSIRN